MPASRAESSPSTAEALLAEIARRYRQLEALPTEDRPKGSRRSGWSAMYTALVLEIRRLADQYKAITAA